MPVELPRPISAYLEANRGFDVDAMLAPFAETAVVRDERRTHRGRPAIRAWIEEATVANRAVATAEAAKRDGRDHLVRATVTGAFPGSPVVLQFRFRLAGDRIAGLEIS